MAKGDCFRASAGLRKAGGYRLTRFADDWVVTCESAAEARAATAAALRILSELGVQLHPQKTRIVHVQRGFEFLGYLVKRGKQLQLPPPAQHRSLLRSASGLPRLRTSPADALEYPASACHARTSIRSCR